MINARREMTPPPPPPWTTNGVGPREAGARSASPRAIAATSGALLALAFPAVDWNPLAWVALVPLLWVGLGRGVGAAFRAGWVAGMLFFVATLYWLVLTIGTYTNLSPLVSVGPVLLLCAVLALFFGGFMAGCEWARANGVELALVAPPLWVVLEWVRTYVFGGFPWVALGYSQYRTTYLIQFAELTGIYGISALVVLVNVVVYGAFRQWRDGQVPGTRALLALSAVLMVLVAWGFWRVRQLEQTPPAGAIRVGFIQGNIAQDEKWDPEYQQATLDRYEQLTDQAVAAGAELVVWPETAAPFFFQNGGDLRDRLVDIAESRHIWLLFGSPAFSRGDDDEALLYNRAYLVAPDGGVDRYYDKMTLVPFGEYVPLQRLFFFVHKVVEGVGELRAGTEPVVFQTDHGRFGTLICYEGIFPGLTRRFVAAGADFLVNITNDAWFGRTSAPYQHLAMVTVRAIENRVPVVRVANTGFSAMVDVDGRIRWRTKLFTADWRVDTVRWPGVTTVYAQIGDVFVWLCMLILAAVVLFVIARPRAMSMDGRQPA